MRLPEIPKGGLLTVTEIAAALAFPLLLKRILRYRLVFSVILPKLNGVLLEYGTHPPVRDSNSRTACGKSEPVASKSTNFIPPLELICRYTA